MTTILNLRGSMRDQIADIIIMPHIYDVLLSVLTADLFIKRVIIFYVDLSFDPMECEQR